MKKLNTYIQEKLVIDKTVKTPKKEIKEDYEFLFAHLREVSSTNKAYKFSCEICKCVTISDNKITFKPDNGASQTEAYIINDKGYVELNESVNIHERALCLTSIYGIELLKDILDKSEVNKSLLEKYFDKEDSWIKDIDSINYTFWTESIKRSIKRLEEND